MARSHAARFAARIQRTSWAFSTAAEGQDVHPTPARRPDRQQRRVSESGSLLPQRLLSLQWKALRPGALRFGHQPGRSLRSRRCLLHLLQYSSGDGRESDFSLSARPTTQSPLPMARSIFAMSRLGTIASTSGASRPSQSIQLTRKKSSRSAGRRCILERSHWKPRPIRCRITKTNSARTITPTISRRIELQPEGRANPRIGMCLQREQEITHYRESGSIFIEVSWNTGSARRAWGGYRQSALRWHARG